MNTLNISANTKIEKILSAIEDDFVLKNLRFTLLRFESDVSANERKNTIALIKKYFDIFIILKSSVPDQQGKIEEYFSYGTHGVYFYQDSAKYSAIQLEIISSAAQIFPDGLVFVNVGDNKLLIEKVLSSKIIPVVTKCNVELVEFIMSHNKFNEISSVYLKYIPVLEENLCDFSLINKLQLKMRLETLNLRQKLMVKSVADSLNSSGL
ncbi:MAG: hypothetical protein ACD_20C00123G0005 [uncultured bacterium]|nr:MAG: hypothetical protein ACD_20C00123G0005 [uncultured bacterium]HBH18983.1 hypothetical protein [Cyanobacteria bacterium UBA9579]